MMVTYYVVQSFQTGKRGALIADQPVQAQSSDHAKRIAERLSSKKAGVVAFSREGDPTTGDWEDSVVLFSRGSLPPEAEEMAA